MAGYEDLTPDQLIYIMHLAVVMVVTFAIAVGVIRPLLHLMTARVIQFRIEKEVAKEIVDKIALKKSWIQQIKLWWVKRKEKKVDPMDKYIITPR